MTTNRKQKAIDLILSPEEIEELENDKEARKAVSRLLAQRVKEKEEAELANTPVKIDYTREELIELCERAISPQKKWHDCDSAHSQLGLGQAWALLKAGCEFKILTTENDGSLNTNHRAIWVEIVYQGFRFFEMGEGYETTENFYIPTPRRLEEAGDRDWY